MFPPRLTPQALRRHGARGTRPQPLVPKSMAGESSNQSPYSPVFRPRSRKYLQLSYRKRYAPTRAEWRLEPAKTQNSDASTIQTNPTPSVPLQPHYAPLDRGLPPSSMRGPMHACRSILSLARSLPPSSSRTTLSLLDAIRKGPDSRDK